MNRSKAALRALVLVAALAAGLGVTSPAYASTGVDKWIDYDVEITCSSGRTIEVEMQRWEADSVLNGADDFIGDSTHVHYFSGTASDAWTVTGVLPDNDGGFDQYSETYQIVRFRVTSSNGVHGSWTAWEPSAARSIHV